MSSFERKTPLDLRDCRRFSGEEVVVMMVMTLCTSPSLRVELRRRERMRFGAGRNVDWD